MNLPWWGYVRKSKEAAKAAAAKAAVYSREDQVYLVCPRKKRFVGSSLCFRFRRRFVPYQDHQLADLHLGGDCRSPTGEGTHRPPSGDRDVSKVCVHILCHQILIFTVYRMIQTRESFNTQDKLSSVITNKHLQYARLR